MNCDICYNNINLNKIICCKNKKICDNCLSRYNKIYCPFCRQKIIINKRKNFIISNKSTCKFEPSILIYNINNLYIFELY